MGSVNSQDKKKKKKFQEQEVNNAGIPLRVHITIVVSQVNVLQTRFIILQCTIVMGGVWWSRAGEQTMIT